MKHHDPIVPYEKHVTEVKVYDLKSRFMKPTLFSRRLSLILFIVIPLVALFAGYTLGYAQGLQEGQGKITPIAFFFDK